MSICVSVYKLMHFATMSGTLVPLQEMKLWVIFSTGRGVNLMYPSLFTCLLLKISFSVWNAGSPRGDEDVGEVTFHADPVFLRFDVTAFPTPTEVTFTFMGPSGNGTGSPQTEPDGIRLEGVCGPHKAVVFRTTCFVIVSNVTTQRAAGFYRVTVTNTQGSAHFRLQVRYKGRSEPGRSNIKIGQSWQIKYLGRSELAGQI